MPQEARAPGMTSAPVAGGPAERVGVFTYKAGLLPLRSASSLSNTEPRMLPLCSEGVNRRTARASPIAPIPDEVKTCSGLESGIGKAIALASQTAFGKKPSHSHPEGTRHGTSCSDISKAPKDSPSSGEPVVGSCPQLSALEDPTTPANGGTGEELDKASVQGDLAGSSESLSRCRHPSTTSPRTGSAAKAGGPAHKDSQAVGASCLRICDSVAHVQQSEHRVQTPGSGERKDCGVTVSKTQMEISQHEEDGGSSLSGDPRARGKALLEEEERCDANSSCMAVKESTDPEESQRDLGQVLSGSATASASISCGDSEDRGRSTSIASGASGNAEASPNRSAEEARDGTHQSGEESSTSVTPSPVVSIECDTFPATSNPEVAPTSVLKPQESFNDDTMHDGQEAGVRERVTVIDAPIEAPSCCSHTLPPASVTRKGIEDELKTNAGVDKIPGPYGEVEQATEGGADGTTSEQRPQVTAAEGVVDLPTAGTAKVTSDLPAALAGVSDTGGASAGACTHVGSPDSTSGICSDANNPGSDNALYRNLDTRLVVSGTCETRSSPAPADRVSAQGNFTAGSDVESSVGLIFGRGDVGQVPPNGATTSVGATTGACAMKASSNHDIAVQEESFKDCGSADRGSSTQDVTMAPDTKSEKLHEGPENPEAKIPGPAPTSRGTLASSAGVGTTSGPVLEGKGPTRSAYLFLQVVGPAPSEDKV